MSEVKRPELWGGRMLSEDEKEQADAYMDELEFQRDQWKHWKMKASQAAERLEAENRELREQCLKWSGMYRGLLDEIKALEEDTHE